MRSCSVAISALIVFCTAGENGCVKLRSLMPFITACVPSGSQAKSNQIKEPITPLDPEGNQAVMQGIKDRNFTQPFSPAVQKTIKALIATEQERMEKEKAF